MGKRVPRRKTVKRDYTTVSIPMSLVGRIDNYLAKEDAIYKSMVDFVLSAIRKELRNLGLLDTGRRPILAHFNLNEEGVRILDRTINRIVDIAFKPDGIWCDYCEARNCHHIQFALAQTEIQHVIRRKRKEGWKLPEV